jgi:hypothetical protein
MKLMRLAFVIALLISAASDQLVAQNPAGAASDEVRKALDQEYANWGKARIAGDHDVFERMLAPDFYVQFADKRATRQEFVQQISNKSNTTRKRFDSKILTVQPNGDAWETVILEKLEYVWKDKENKAHEVFALWVTRDGWKKNGNDWKALYSKELSHELWENGARPPLADW